MLLQSRLRFPKQRTLQLAVAVYSYRSATMGSTLVARRAGM